MISSLLRNNVAKFPKKEILSGHKEFRKQVGKYDKEFWKNNNIIEITNSQKIQIDNIKGENK